MKRPLVEEIAAAVTLALVFLSLAGCAHRPTFEEVDTKCRNYSAGRPSETYQNCMNFTMEEYFDRRARQRAIMQEAVSGGDTGHPAMNCTPSVITRNGAAAWRCQ